MYILLNFSSVYIKLYIDNNPIYKFMYFVYATKQNHVFIELNM